MQVGKSTRFIVASLSIVLGFSLLLLSFFLPVWANSPESWPIPRLVSLGIGAALLLGGLFQLMANLIKPVNIPAQPSEELETCLENLKIVREKLVLQEKLVQVGLLTAGIAHEIKNPLNFVTNFSQTSVEILEELKESLENFIKDPSDKNKEDMVSIIDDLSTNVKKIAEHGKRAESIVMNMLMQARSEEALEKESVEVNHLLEEDINLAYHGLRAQDPTFNIKIEKDLNISAGSVYVKSQSVGRVFLNILNNGMYAAFKATELKPDHKPVIKISSSGDENQAVIKIRDNGVGIKKENLAKIFEPFFTTKPKGQGTGLGLSICYDVIVKEHHGEIKVDSEEGVFTEFTIILQKQKQ